MLVTDSGLEPQAPDQLPTANSFETMLIFLWENKLAVNEKNKYQINGLHSLNS